MNTSARSWLLLVVGSIGLVSGCAGTGASPSGSPGDASSRTSPMASRLQGPSQSLTATLSDAPSAPTSSSGNRTCVSSSDGPEVECLLEAGTYATVGLRPGLTYTVPSPGWSSLNREVAPGNFHLFPPGGSMAGFDAGTTDDITVITAVAPPGTCTGKPSETFAQTFGGMIEFLTKNQHIAVANRHETSVGGWSGTVMDVRFLKGDGCSDGVYADLMIGVEPAHGAFSTTPGMEGARLFLLRHPTVAQPLAVIVDDAANGGSAYGDGAAWYAAAQSVIDTFVFAP